MIKLITACLGKRSCAVFKSPEDLLKSMDLPHDVRNLMTAMEIVKSWRRQESCPFRVKDSGGKDGEEFHVAICSIASHPPFSMDAVSRGTGYSKTRVAQIEYTAFRKMRRVLGKAALENEVLDKA